MAISPMLEASATVNRYSITLFGISEWSLYGPMLQLYMYLYFMQQFWWYLFYQYSKFIEYSFVYNVNKEKK